MTFAFWRDYIYHAFYLHYRNYILLSGSFFVLFLAIGCDHSVDYITVREAQNRHLLLGNGSQFNRLDPQIAFDGNSRRIQMALFEPLVKINVDLEPIPALAESWKISEDRTVYQFFLRKNARWSDGHPVTAHDCVCAFEHLLSPAIANAVVWFAYVIKNAEDFNRGVINSFNQVGVKAISDYVLEVTLKEPAHHFLSMMSYMAFAPIPRHHILKYGAVDSVSNYWDKPDIIVSNGPFRVNQYVFNDYLIVEKNPYYWAAESVFLEHITFFPIANALTEEQAFLNHQLHITYALPPHKLPHYIEKMPECLYMQKKYAATELFLINTQIFPLNQKSFRQALNLAIDRKALCDLYTDKRYPALGFVSADAPYYKSLPDLLSFDPEKARSLLKESVDDVSALPPITINYSSSIDYKPFAEVLQAQWESVLGLKINIEQTDTRTHWSKLIRRDFNLARLVWRVECMDPGAILGFFASNCLSNPTGWSDPEFDELINKGMVEEDILLRESYFQQAEALLLQGGPVIPFFYQPHAYLVDPSVLGWEIKGASWIDYANISFKSL